MNTWLQLMQVSSNVYTNMLLLKKSIFLHIFICFLLILVFYFLNICLFVLLNKSSSLGMLYARCDIALTYSKPEEWQWQ